MSTVKMSNREDLLGKILTEQETIALTRLANDDTVLSALKKVLLMGVYYNGALDKENTNIDPMRNFAMQIDPGEVLSNEQLGVILRAKTQGIVTVEICFRELVKFKSQDEKPKPKPKVAR